MVKTESEALNLIDLAKSCRVKRYVLYGQKPTERYELQVMYEEGGEWETVYDCKPKEMVSILNNSKYSIIFPGIWKGGTDKRLT